MSTLLQDLKFGLRMLARNRGFTLFVTMLLALGMGATTAVFSLFDAVFLRPLPVRRPAELVRMVEYVPKLPIQSSFPYVYYEALHEHARALMPVFGETGQSLHFAMSDPGPTEEITVYGVTADYFSGLGVRAVYGRLLLPDDAKETPGTPPAVLSYGFWQRRFGGDRKVIDERTILVNGHRFVNVGVTPRDFNGTAVETAPDVRIPLRPFQSLAGFSRDQLVLELGGRLRSGVSLLQAEAECRALWQSTLKDYFQTPRRPVSVVFSSGMALIPLTRGVSFLRDRYGDPLKLLMGSVTLLLLIVCTNVAGLLLERAAARQQEIAVRLAIGATRYRLIRQVLTENLLLIALGAVTGLLVALVGGLLAGRLMPPIRGYPNPYLVPLAVNYSLDWRALLFVLLLSLVTMLLLSVSPALAFSRSNLDSQLRTTRSSARIGGRQALIALQIALCTFLLVIATLFVRTSRQLQKVDPGFDRDHIATFTFNLTGYGGNRAALLKELIVRANALPAVVSVGVSRVGVMRGIGMAMTVAPAGERIGPADFMNASVNDVSPEYFEAMGMHILSGRGFTASDALRPKQAGPVKVVANHAFVQRFFPNSDPLGKLFGPGPAGSVVKGIYEIVGEVSDAKYRSLRAPIVPTFYSVGTDFDQFVLDVRTRTRSRAIISPLRKTLASLDPGLAFLEVHTMAEEADISMAGERITAAVASVFGGIAALIVGVGIYGLLAYAVTQRRREIGIRMALGAASGHVLQLIVGRGLKLTLIGLGIGIVGSLAATRLIASLLYGVTPTDLLTSGSVALLVSVLALLASYIPARRATKVDPVEALRYE